MIHTERVVVGKRETPTPIFSQDMEQVIFHPELGHARVHQEAGRPAEPDTRQHPHLHLLPTAHPARRPRRRPGDRRLVDRRHPQVPRLSAAGREQCAGQRSSSASPTSTTSTCTTRRRSSCSMRTCAPSVMAACACATRSGWPSCCWPRTRAGRRSASPPPSAGRGAEQPGQPRSEGPRAHHLLHRRGRTTTASSSCSPTSTATRAGSRSAWRARRISSRAKERAPAQAEAVGSLAETQRTGGAKKDWRAGGQQHLWKLLTISCGYCRPRGSVVRRARCRPDVAA